MNKYFCIIGAQRCGTTYLYRILDKHPQVEMAKPMRPEPKFFLSNDEYKKGKTFYLNKYFPKEISEKKIIGEKSASYIEFDLSKKILSFFPNAKVLVMLRNPVERAISNYFFSFNNGLESRSLAEVFLQKKPPPKLSNKKVSVSPFHYVERGYYSKYLKPYLNAFGNDIKVNVFENFINNKKEIEEVFNFLDVYKNFEAKGINRIYNGGNYQQTEELKRVKEVLQKFYQEEVKRIESLIGADIPQWN